MLVWGTGIQTKKGVAAIVLESLIHWGGNKIICFIVKRYFTCNDFRYIEINIRCILCLNSHKIYPFKGISYVTGYAIPKQKHYYEYYFRK